MFAIAGIPPLAGFFSKDEILYRTFASQGHNGMGIPLWLVGLLTAGMTSFYMFRLWYKTFFGRERFDESTLSHGVGAHGTIPTGASSRPKLAMENEHDEGQTAHPHGVHESPWVMLLPLAVLAVLSVVGGWFGVPAALGGGNHFEHFLDPVFALSGEPRNAVNADQVSHGLELGLAAVSVLVAAAGWYFAYLFFVQRPGTLGARAAGNPLYRLVSHKYYIDEVYQTVVVLPVMMLSRLAFIAFDQGVVNGSGNLAGFVTRSLGSATRRMQSGNLRSYAGWLAAGAAAVILIMTYTVLTAHAAVR